MVSQVVIEHVQPRFFLSVFSLSGEDQRRSGQILEVSTVVSNEDLASMTMESSLGIKGGYREIGSAQPSGAKNSNRNDRGG